MEVRLQFVKRWGVPEGFYEGDAGWDIGGYDGGLHDEYYRCDWARYGGPGLCKYERVVARAAYLPHEGRFEEVCRNHIPLEDRDAFNAFADTAEEAFRVAGKRLCEANGHKKPVGDWGGQCYCRWAFRDELVAVPSGTPSEAASW